MGDFVRLDPRPAGEFTVDGDGVPVRGSYVEGGPPRRLVPTRGHAGSDAFPPGSHRVEVTLAAAEIIPAGAG